MRARYRLLIFTGVIALCGCERKPEGDEPRNAVTEAPAKNRAEKPVPADAKAEKKTAELPAAPPPQVSDDQQVRDDADATGLTARIPDEEEPAPSPSAGTNEVGQQP